MKTCTEICGRTYSAYRTSFIMHKQLLNALYEHLEAHVTYIQYVYSTFLQGSGKIQINLLSSFLKNPFIYLFFIIVAGLIFYILWLLFHAVFSDTHQSVWNIFVLLTDIWHKSACLIKRSNKANMATLIVSIHHKHTHVRILLHICCSSLVFIEHNSCSLPLSFML